MLTCQVSEKFVVSIFALSADIADRLLEVRCHFSVTLGCLSNDDVDGNENGKEAIGLDKQTTTLHVHTFLYIS